MKPDKPSASLEIVSLAAGGRGVARPEGGPVWLVHGGLPGDHVEAVSLVERPRLIEARVLRLVTPSSDRRDPPCPVQSECGGCAWMPLPESDQRTWKRRLVIEALERIGGISPPVDELIGGDSLLGYRNKVELTLVARPGGGLAPAMHGPPGAPPIPIEACPIQHREADVLLADLARELAAVDDPRAAQARVGVRRAAASGELLLVIQHDGVPLKWVGGLADRLMARHAALVGVVRLERRHPQRGSTVETVVRGRGWLADVLDGVKFRLPASSFAQVNSELSNRLIDLVDEGAGEVRGAVVFDLYGGLGGYAMRLARRGARVTVCDADAAAIRAGRAAAREAAIRGVGFVRSDIARWLGGETARDRPSLVIANPPRSGLDRRVCQALVSLAAPRLVIVSCDPPTLARDLRRLVAAGYTVDRVTPIDLFPQTPHVETVTVLRRETG